MATCAIVRWIEQPGERTALIDAATGRSFSYAQLAAEVLRTAAALGAERKSLVACLCRRDVDTVIGYLAALASGHAAMLLDATRDRSEIDRLLDRYQPEFVISDGIAERRPRAAGGAVHEDLAVLMCTSGSTGSPKFVRLSARNLDANAAQIAECLEIDGGERAMHSLPLQYSYGLSVLNSHLLSGATVVLTRESVVRPALWDEVRRYECTSLAGVPHTFTIMAKIGFERMRLPSLRTLTQAGGAMPPEMVLQFAGIMRARGGRLVVMYGQTEATARIAYLPPERVFDKPGCVGIPVPRGRLSLASGGELVYEGPNVMLGYATDRDDLARGDDNHGILATGDLGTVDGDGYFSITGRKRRMAKLCGRRINLDELEALLAATSRVVALELDGELVLVRADGATVPAATDLARTAAHLLALPRGLIAIHELAELPLTAAGKLDYKGIERAVRSRTSSRAN